MDIGRVDLLLQYALLIASEEDEYIDRSLGPIHLLKYVYLADLAYAESNEGKTYTGIEWKFYSFGPWSPDAYNRIEPALNRIGAEHRIIPSKYSDDTVRWSLKHASNDHAIADLEKKIDVKPKHAVKKFVHKFKSDTESLLHYVYQTRPMLTSAPGEIICFHPIEIVPLDSIQKKEKLFSKKQLKGLKNLKEQIQQQMQIKLAEKKAVINREIVSSPRYDDVFFEGQKWLDSLAGEPVQPSQGELQISPEIWKSKARFDDEIS